MKIPLVHLSPFQSASMISGRLRSLLDVAFVSIMEVGLFFPVDRSVVRRAKWNL